VHVAAERIEHAHLMAAARELTQNVLTDEAGAAGEQHLHRDTAMRMVALAGSAVASPA